MEIRDYDAAGYKAQHEEDEEGSDYSAHPGYLLRGELSSVEAPDKTPALGELLYTAVETGILEGVDVEDALTIWRLVEMSRRLSPDRIKMLKM